MIKFKLSLSRFGFGQNLNQAPWSRFLFGTGVRQARKANADACHTWACYRWIRIAWLQVSWLSYNDSKNYYHRGLTKQDFGFGIDGGWTIHNLTHF